jgi:hypothetical protein
VDGANSYLIQYIEAGENKLPTTIVATGNSKQLTDLKSGTKYQYRIVANCVGIGASAYGYGEFTTLSSKAGEAISNMSLYPNPTSDVVNVFLNTGMQESSNVSIEVYNTLGQKVYEWYGSVADQYSHSVNLSGEASGQYMVKTKIGQQIHTRILNVTK